MKFQILTTSCNKSNNISINIFLILQPFVEIILMKNAFRLSYKNFKERGFSNTIKARKCDIASWKNVVCSFTFCAQLTYKMKRTRYCGLLFWTIRSLACLLFSHDFATFCSSFWNIINQSFFKNTERDNKCLFCVYHI